MPFDPRVIHNDDDFIPDDEQLEMLGAQLRDDARHLANVYPAKKSDVAGAIDPPQPLTSSRAALLVTASAACLVLGLFVSLTWMRGAPEQAATIVLSPPSEVEVVSPTSPVPPVEQFVPVMTPVVHQNLTGPELEAVLDLLESDAEAEQSVSL